MPKYKKFLRVASFYFLGSQSYFLKYKKFFRVSVYWNIRKFRFLKYRKIFQGFHFPKYKKSFLLRKSKKILNIRVRKLIFPEYKKFSQVVFLFFELDLKSVLSSSIIYYLESYKSFWVQGKFLFQVHKWPYDFQKSLDADNKTAN